MPHAVQCSRVRAHGAIADWAHASRRRAARLLETGIKVIDVMCPLVAGGTVALAGDLGAGMTVVMEELARRLSGGSDPLSIFVMMPPPSPEWPYSEEPGFSHAEALRKEGYSEGTVGAVQTFSSAPRMGHGRASVWPRSPPWTPSSACRANAAQAKVYPTVDVLASRHACWKRRRRITSMHASPSRVRQALASLWATPGGAKSRNNQCCCNARSRCRTTSPSRSSAPSLTATGPGVTVSAAEAVRSCAEILDGRHDDVPVEAFYFSGDIAEIRTNGSRDLRLARSQCARRRMIKRIGIRRNNR